MLLNISLRVVTFDLRGYRRFISIFKNTFLHTAYLLAQNKASKVSEKYRVQYSVDSIV